MVTVTKLLIIKHINCVHDLHLKPVSHSVAVSIAIVPRKAVFVYKIAPNRFKSTHRFVLTFEEKKQSITHLFQTSPELRLGCIAFILAKKFGKYGQLNVSKPAPF